MLRHMWYIKNIRYQTLLDITFYKQQNDDDGFVLFYDSVQTNFMLIRAQYLLEMTGTCIPKVQFPFVFDKDGKARFTGRINS